MIVQIVIGLFIVFLVFMLYKHLYGIPSNGKGIFGIDLIGGIRGVERFQINPAGLDYTMGKYGGLKNLEKNLEYCLSKKNTCEKLIPSKKCDNDMCKYKIAPNVDGTPSSGRSLDIFKFNRSSPDCCPSAYSTSSGCVCLTDAQKNMISANRGSNSVV